MYVILTIFTQVGKIVTSGLIIYLVSINWFKIMHGLGIFYFRPLCRLSGESPPNSADNRELTVFL